MTISKFKANDHDKLEDKKWVEKIKRNMTPSLIQDVHLRIVKFLEYYQFR
jgi:hypothetical protein